MPRKRKDRANTKEYRDGYENIKWEQKKTYVLYYGKTKLGTVPFFSITEKEGEDNE